MEDIPTTLGKYKVLGVAGRGNMGVVYVAHDPFSDSKVAIKVCSVPGDEKDQSNDLTRRMFFNEAYTAGSLEHPNILKVFDAGAEDGVPYIVMEYVKDAQTLRSFCNERHRLTLKIAVRLIYQCAKALDYAHRRGVIHRDIKPSNVMLTAKDHVKIGDFGIAQRAYSDSNQPSAMIGSPRYMSPEQLQQAPIASQTDLFSLGVVAYELLVGKPPFRAKGISRLLYQIINDEPEPPSTYRSEIPPALEKIVLRALEKEPEKRYKTGMELAADLANIFNDLERTEDITEDQKFRRVRTLRFFNDFSDTEVSEVIKASTWETCYPGECIISEGNMEHSFFIIVDGDVIVTKNEREISTLTKGDCFGEMGYLSGRKRTASIVAKDNIALLKINSALMERASITCQLRFNKIFLQTLIERLAYTSEDLTKSRS